ncbi:hypothetical protein ACG7TL_004031 [Trametes sanguinea]
MGGVDSGGMRAQHPERAGVNVDSANTTAIQYESYGPSPWQLVQTGNNGNIFAQTLTKVEGTGGAVFHFHGTSVQVYGTVTPPTDPGATVTSSYAIDGAQAGSFSSSTVPAALINEQDGQLFFDSGTISDGDHTLVINVTLASAAEPYQIDYIKYTATKPNSTSSSSTGTATGSTTPSATAGSSGSSHTDVGPIVGGVVGGVLGVALITGIGLFLFFRYFRHRISLSGRRRGGRDLVEDLVENGKPGSDTDPSSTGPFMSDLSASTPWRPGTPNYGGLPPPSVPYAASSTVGPEDSASQVAGRIYAAEMAQASGSSRSPGASLLGPGSRTDAKQPIPPSVPEEPEVEAVQHQDSGIRFRSGDVPPVLPVVPIAPPPAVDDIDELPPDYAPPPSSHPE